MYRIESDQFMKKRRHTNVIFATMALWKEELENTFHQFMKITSLSNAIIITL